MSLDLTPTVALVASFLAIALFAGWRGARAPDPHRGPRLVPWRFIMMLSAALAIFMVVHLVNLFGITTGRPQTYG